MTFKLNGWQRIWGLASSVYFVIVSVYVFVEFPQPEKITHDRAYVKLLSAQSQALLVPEDNEGWQKAEDWGADVEMPNATNLSFRKGVSKKDMSIVAKEYWALITATANERRWSLIGFATLWWLLPSIALYFFGWAIGWVRRGFQSKG